MTDKEYLKAVESNLDKNMYIDKDLLIAMIKHIDKLYIEPEELAEIINSGEIEVGTFYSIYENWLSEEDKKELMEYMGYSDKTKFNKAILGDEYKEFQKAVFKLFLDQNKDVHEYSFEDDIVIIITA